jgi:hypothetical protein
MPTLAQILQRISDGYRRSSMSDSARKYAADENTAIGKRLDGRMRVIAKQSVTVWFNRDRLDRLLAAYISQLDDCELLYAIDENGRQVSSNIHTDSIDASAYGQDLSQRPYAVSLSVLNNVAAHGAFTCGAYTSQVTRRECVTVMYGVTTSASLMGYIAADIFVAAEPTGDAITSAT